MKNIFIFDMDGTLTPSRRKMTKDFEEFYSNWAENHTFFLVSGSNLEKIKEQVPEYILNLSEGFLLAEEINFGLMESFPIIMNLNQKMIYYTSLKKNYMKALML